MKGSDSWSLKRLVIISGDYPPVQSGEAGHALHLARAMAARGITVDVLTSAVAGVKHDPAFAVHPVMRDWSWSSAPRLAAFLRRQAPDAVLLLYLDGMYGSHPMMTFLPSLVRAIVPRARVVTQFEHTGRTDGVPSLGRRVSRKLVASALGGATVNYLLGTLLRDSDQIIALNEPQRLALADVFPPAASKLTLIPPPPLMRVVPEADGAARTRGRALLGARPDEFLVLYYGYMYPGKGIETLLDAAHRVVRSGVDLRLVLAGEVLGHALSQNDPQSSGSYKQALHERVTRLCLEDHVTWTGACSPDGEEGSLYMWGADLCVLPFDKGIQLNNSTFAAAATHALPILTTRGAELETPFIHRDNVWLCPPLDPAALADSIITLHGAPELRGKLREGAARMARDLFSWESAVDRTIALIDSTARRSEAASA